MGSVWNKIDSGLALIYADFLFLRDPARASAPARRPVVAQGRKLHVLLRYEGSLAVVEQAGFETIATAVQGQASGALRLEDLGAIAQCDEVLSIHFGTEHHIDLDVSIPQIGANQVWSQDGPPLYEFHGITGAGVIIGVIDTGVDVNHPFLWRQSLPGKVTRILRLWDMGLEIIADEDSPDVALLHPDTPGTYGVEYFESQINDFLNKKEDALRIRTKDCAGHGTHVASTAAGDGRFKFKYRGVAPRAGLVIVKQQALEKFPEVGTTIVGPDQQFKNAVFYIRNVAASFDPPRPFVINYSVGSAVGAHDGFDPINDWLNNEFRDTVSAGKIFVCTAGNEAGFMDETLVKRRNEHARIEFAGPGTVHVPLELFDNRGGNTVSQATCSKVNNTMVLKAEFYYPNGGATVFGSLRVQGETVFTDGPPLSFGVVQHEFAGRRVDIRHGVDEGTKDGVLIKRNVFRIVLSADSNDMHLVGDYIVTLTASDPVTMHLWCTQFDRLHGLRIADPPLPPEMVVEDRFQIGTPGAVKNVITVGAYDARDPVLDVAHFTSRGPVVRHGVGGTPPPKPDIGAPGFHIWAAKSSSILPPEFGIVIERKGTSMAAPHVSGAIALMLQKNKTLTPTDVRNILKTSALKVPAPVPEEIGVGRLDVKAAVENTTP